MPPVAVELPPLLPLEPLPQPIAAPAIIAKSSATDRMRSVRMERSAFLLRRRTGTPKNRSAASAKPPPAVKRLFSGTWSLAVVCAVVLIVSVEVSVAPASVTEAGDREQVGPSVAPVGLAVTAHVKATEPA